MDLFHVPSIVFIHIRWIMARSVREEVRRIGLKMVCSLKRIHYIIFIHPDHAIPALLDHQDGELRNDRGNMAEL
jgi:hypothetical protein